MMFMSDISYLCKNDPELFGNSLEGPSLFVGTKNRY